MILRITYCLLSLVVIPFFLQAQVDSAAMDLLQTSFLKEKQEIASSESHFNVLKITNPTDATVEFSIKYTVPAYWSFVGDEDKKYSIAAGETLFLPFRINPSVHSKGGVSYVIVANLTLDNGKKIQNAYCYIYLKREPDITVRSLTRIEYFDVETKKGEIKIEIKNNGNIEELMYIKLQSSPMVTIPGEEKNILIKTVVVPINSDTIVKFDVYKTEKSAVDDKIKLKTIKIQVFNQDTSFTYHVWFKEMESRFVNTVSYKSPLEIGLNFNNLLGSRLGLSANVQGTVLLKKQRDIYYRFDFRPLDHDIWNNSRMLVGYKDKTLEIQAGDVAGVGQVSFGRGIYANYLLKEKHDLYAAATYSFYNKSYSGGFGYRTVFNRFSLLAEGGYGKDNYRNIESKIGSLGFGFSFLQHHHIFTYFSLSDALHQQDTSFHKIGYSTRLNYSGKINRLLLTVNNIYSSRDYVGRNASLTQTRGNVFYPFSDKADITLDAIYSKNYYNNDYIGDSLPPPKYYQLTSYDLFYRYKFTPRFQFYSGHLFEKESSNNFYDSEEDEYFASTSSDYYIGCRFLEEKFHNTFSPKVSVGFTKITSYYTYIYGYFHPEFKDMPPFLRASATASLRRRFWGIQAGYYYGPHSFYQQFSYFYTGYNPRYFRISPYFEKSFYDERLLFTTRANYFVYTSHQSERLNINTNILWDIGKGWHFRLDNSFFSNVRVDPKTREAYNSRGFYLGMSIRKVFDLPQPRIKYYNVTFAFFKDYNGNNTLDKNEPGIKNILISISRDTAETNQKEDLVFSPVELLSDFYGQIEYEKMPEGVYVLKYTTLNNDIERFKPIAYEERVLINKSQTYYIPYKEYNKIYGQAILFRDQFSSLGSISLRNIKVTATDSAGNVYSTLTERDGRFVLMVPQSGTYNVKINNIFYQNFTLAQNNYKIDFNGFKEYEITFVFYEKPRDIHFNGKDEGTNIPAVPFDNNNLLKSPDEFQRAKQKQEQEAQDRLKKEAQTNKATTTKLTDEEQKEKDRVERILNGEEELIDKKDFEDEGIDTAATIKFIEKVLDGGQDAKQDKKENAPAEQPKEKEKADQDTSWNNNKMKSFGTDDQNKQQEQEQPKQETEQPKSEQPAPDNSASNADLMPVSKVNDPGLVFKIQLYSTEKERLKKTDLENFKDVMCIQGPDGQYLYYSGTYTEFREAESDKLRLISSGMYGASIVPFKDGKVITLEEAGIY